MYQTMVSFAVVALILAGSGCSAKIEGTSVNPLQEGANQDPPKAKDASHVNFVQCSDSATEVLLDVSASDLENKVLNNGVVSIRNLTQADSAYVSVTTDQLPVISSITTTSTENHQYQLSTKAGLAISVETHDFKTGSAFFVATKDQTPLLMNCVLSVKKPGPLSAPVNAPSPVNGPSSEF